MSEATVPDGNGMDGETFFSLLNGRLGESAMKIFAAAYAETMGGGGLAYVRGKTGISSAELKAAIGVLKGQPLRDRRARRAGVFCGTTVQFNSG